MKLKCKKRTDTVLVVRLSEYDTPLELKKTMVMIINFMMQFKPTAYSIPFHIPTDLNYIHYDCNFFKGSMYFNNHQHCDIFDFTTVENLYPDWNDDTENMTFHDSLMYGKIMKFHHNIRRIFGSKNGYVFDYWLQDTIVKRYTQNAKFRSCTFVNMCTSAQLDDLEMTAIFNNDSGFMQNSALCSAYTKPTGACQNDDSVIKQFNVLTKSVVSHLKSNQKQYDFLVFVYFHLLFKTKFPARLFGEDGLLDRKLFSNGKEGEILVLKALKTIITRYQQHKHMDCIDSSFQKVTKFIVSSITGGVNISEKLYSDFITFFKKKSDQKKVFKKVHKTQNCMKEIISGGGNTPLVRRYLEVKQNR